MGAFTPSTKNAILDLVVGGVAYTPAASYSLALTTTAPTKSAPGVEVAGGAYARVVLTNDKVTFSDASGDPPTVSNAIVVQFATADDYWGVVVGADLYDGATRVAYATLTNARQVATGDTPIFAIGALRFRLIGV
jgi:hypothetical protein